MNDTCNSDNKSDPPFYPINIPVVKSRIGRPNGTNKPFWEFSQKQMSTFFEKDYEKIQRTNDVITDCSQSGFITIQF